MANKRPDKFKRWMIASFFLIPLVLFGSTLGSYYFFTPVKMHILIHLLRYQKTATWAFDKIYQEGEEAVPYIIGGLSSKHQPVRYWSLRVLWGLVLRKGVDYKPALTQIVKLVSDPDFAIRHTAAEVLGKIGADEAVGPLIKLLSHPRREVRYSAAFALGKIGSEKAVRPLIKTLCDPDDWVCMGAIEALGKIGSDKAVGRLIDCLEQKPMPGARVNRLLSVQLYGVEALEKITGQNFGDIRVAETLSQAQHQAIIQKWLDWWEENKEKYEVGDEGKN